MARPLRIEYPGAFYHVINRGNGGERIFINDRDREKFLEYVEAAVESFEINVHTYCLMKNHYHLLVETPHPNLSRAVKWINGSYVTYFNRKRQRPGHLFQGRFKSILVDADEYLKPLSRYIHLNPVRAKIVQKLESYPWSSYPAFIGTVKPPNLLKTDWLLGLFGRSRKTAYRNYRNYVEGTDISEIEDPGKETVSGFLLGGVEFAGWVKETFLSGRTDQKEVPQLRELMPRITPQAVIETVAHEFGCTPDHILEKGKKKNLARDVAIYLAREMTGRSGVDLGVFFGNISGSGITVRGNQIADQLVRNRRLKGRINRIKKAIINN
jgi:REP element-mobilizing transposase RayT